MCAHRAANAIDAYFKSGTAARFQFGLRAVVVVPYSAYNAPETPQGIRGEDHGARWSNMPWSDVPGTYAVPGTRGVGRVMYIQYTDAINMYSVKPA